MSKTKPTPTPTTPTNPTFAYNAMPVPSPLATYSPYFMDAPTFDLPYVPEAPVSTPLVPAAPARRPHAGHRRTSSAPSYESTSWTVPPPAPLLNSPAQLESSAWMYNGWSAALPVPSIELEATATAPLPFTPTRAFPSVLEQTPLHAAYLSHTPMKSSPLVPQHYQMMSTPMASVPTMSMAPMPQLDYSYNYTSLAAPASCAPMQLSTSSSHLLPTGSTPKGLNIQTASTPNMGYHCSPPITPTAYYTPYSTPSLYSSSGSSAGHSSTYTPSPPAYSVSPTLPAKSLPKADRMVGLGLGMGLGMPAVEQDVFYTPALGSEEYYAC
jgi:hypothetical protein